MVGEPYRKALEERRSAEARGALWLALFLAALLHYPILHGALALSKMGGGGEGAAVVDWDVTEVSLLEGLDLSSTMSETEREAARRRVAAQELSPDEVEDMRKGQVVELPPQPDHRPPIVPTPYLAKHDSRTEEETRKAGDPQPADAGAGAGAPGEGPTPANTATAPSANSKEAPPTSRVPTEALAMVQDEGPAGREAEPPARVVAGRVSLLELGEGELRIAPEVLNPPRPGGAMGGGAPPYSALLPPVSLGGGGGGGGDFGSDDYLPDVAEGDRTVLNARQFKYWGFFQRVKDSIRRNWNPTAEYRRADPSGRVYGVRDRMTVLAVRLDRHGSLMDLSLREGSGVAPLDDEAMRAFRAAQPFPNPPRGLVAEDGTIEFSFGLFLDIRSGWEFRPLRVPAFR